MSAGAIALVTGAIKQRLDQALSLADPGGASNAKTYVGPLDDADAATAHLVLFLYRITPNQSMRNAEHRVSAGAATGQAAVVHRRAVALDLHYLLTAGPRTMAGEVESLRALGFALQALNDAPILAGSPVAGETVRLSLDPLGLDEMSRVWALFPSSNYRTSVLYLASPVWIDPAEADDEAGNVVAHTLQSGHLDAEAR